MFKSINDKQINDTFKIIVKALEDAGYSGGGGSDSYRMFENPPIKLFVRDIAGIDKQPYIIVRKYE